MKTCLFLSVFLLNLSLFGQHEASISMSSKTIWGIAGVEYGLGFSLQNTKTYVTYHSEIVSLFRQRHSIIKNLPAGTYRILDFAISPIDKPSEIRLQDFFGSLELMEGQNYYLGYFIGKRKIGVDKPIIYTLEEDYEPAKLTKSLRNKSIISEDEELIKLYPYNSDTLIIKPEKY